MILKIINMMKRITLITCVAALALTMNACRNKRQISANNIVAAQELSGIYTGILPCASCSSIQTRIDISTDFTYTLQTRYIDRSDEVHTSSGKYKWDAAGKTATFDNRLIGQCLLENNILYMLVDGKKYEGENTENYKLVKVDQDLVEKYWKLLELHGNPIASANSSKEAHIIFHIDGNRFSGDAGCNRFMGSYQIKEHNRIVLSSAAATMMMCLDMETEAKFLQMLETVDSYSVQNDTLLLYRARMAPLAKFAVVYLRR